MGMCVTGLLLLLLLLLLLHVFLLLSTLATAAAGAPSNYTSSFTPEDTPHFWSSTPAGNFTFGFKQVGVGEYLLAIWHSLDVNQTAIWWANFEDINPSSTVKQGASLKYTSSGIMQLYDSTSTPVWQSGNISTSSNLQFLDTGNLRLLQEDNTTALWESFEDRRDSMMLYGLEASSLVNKPRLLQSRSNQTSYARGRFHMATYNRFDIHLFGVDGLNNQYVYSKDFNVSLNISGNEVIVGNQLDGTAYMSNNTGLARVSLDYDGNLRVYEWASSNATWGRVWELLLDSTLVCRAQNPCGPFGLCSEDNSGIVRCICPTGYTPISSEDPSKGCNSTRTPPGCGQGKAGNNITMVEVQHSDYYYNDLYDLNLIPDTYSIENCKNSCLSECRCVAATYSSGNYKCFLKGNTTTGYLVNGLSTGGTTLLMKLLQLPDALPTDVEKGTQRTPIMVIVAVSAILTFVAGMGLVIWWWRRRTNQAEEDNEGWGDTGPRRYSYQELVEATDNFSDMLGEGGFGVVFKGCIKEKPGELAPASEQGRMVVAVKVLKGKKGVDNQAVKQFRAEAGTLGKIHHINLVRLLGYSISGPHGETRLLVYEYMEKGSLDRYLSSAHMTEPLPWSVRYSIAVGTARGIAYLHHECNPRILHCDIKPQNVLLDENFTPKVADFGLASYFGQWGRSHITVSGMRGTRGYMAPDWLKSDAITPKADVYSFGMLLLELVHGLDAIFDENMPLIVWALQCLAAGTLIPDHEPANAGPHGPPDEDVAIEGHTIDMESQSMQTMEQGEGAIQQQLRCLKAALWCVNQVPVRRPSMLQVVQIIEGARNIEDPPDPAARGTINYSVLNVDGALTSTANRVVSYSDLSPR